MKTVFTRQEGVKMNSSIDFGVATSVINEFKYFMDTTETMWDIDIKYFYRITEDNYIQLGIIQEVSELKIIAQYRIRFHNLKDNIIFIIGKNIEAHRPYNGYPVFKNSTVFTEREFDALIQLFQAKTNRINSLATELKSPFIQFLEEKGLNPKPAGNTEYSWVARCPNSKGKHQIILSTEHNEWGCGYCQKGGNEKDLEIWIRELD